jgi:hypothetical protein
VAQASASAGRAVRGRDDGSNMIFVTPVEVACRDILRYSAFMPSYCNPPQARVMALPSPSGDIICVSAAPR